MTFDYTIPLISLVIHLIVEYSTLTMRRSLATHILVRVASTFLICVGSWLLVPLGPKGFVFLYLLNAAYFFPCVYLFSENIAQKLFFFFANWTFTHFVSNLCNWASALLVSPDQELTTQYIFVIGIYIVIMPLYLRYGRKRVREMLFLFTKGNPVYAVFPLLGFALFSVLFSSLKKITSWGEFTTMLLLACFIFFTYYLMFSHFYTIYCRLQVENNLDNAERQLNLQKKYYCEVDKGIRAQQKLLHDTRHHLVAVSRMARTGDVVALEQYVEQLLENYSRSPARRYCENSVANAVIGGYVEIAEEKGIAVSAEIDLPQEIGIDEYELCTLFGNTIENALEACQRIPATSELYGKRYIHIKARTEKGHLVVRIENTFRDDHVRNQGTFRSSKGVLGGIGLESVRMVVDQYQGSLSCERHEDVFVLSAVLCTQSS